MIKTSYYLWPDGNNILCNVWSDGNDDMQTYRIKMSVLRDIYPDLTLEQAINTYAMARFTIFHDVDFEGRFTCYRRIALRRSI